MTKDIKRKPDWAARLKEYVRARLGLPFKYGTIDGPLFAAGALQAMTGADITHGLRGYKTLKGGLGKLKRKGFDDASGPFAAVLEEIAPLHSLPGDILKFEGTLGVCMGVRTVGGAYIVSLERGVALGSLEDAVAAYRVP